MAVDTTDVGGAEAAEAGSVVAAGVPATAVEHPATSASASSGRKDGLRVMVIPVTIRLSGRG